MRTVEEQAALVSVVFRGRHVIDFDVAIGLIRKAQKYACSRDCGHCRTLLEEDEEDEARARAEDKAAALRKGED